MSRKSVKISVINSRLMALTKLSARYLSLPTYKDFTNGKGTEDHDITVVHMCSSRPSEARRQGLTTERGS